MLNDLSIFIKNMTKDFSSIFFCSFEEVVRIDKA